MDLIKNVILAMVCVIAVVTAGSFAYVGYHNTKAHIRTENEKRKAEAPPPEEKPTKKEKAQVAAEKAKAAATAPEEEEFEEDIAHLVQDMYVTPSANGDIAYEYETNEMEEGIFVTPYVVEHRGGPATLHIKAGHRGAAPLEFDRISVKGDQGDRILAFLPGTIRQEESNGRMLSLYDTQVTSDMEDTMRIISVAVNVRVAIVGHEQENKMLSPAEIRRFKNVLALYDILRE